MVAPRGSVVLGGRGCDHFSFPSYLTLPGSNLPILRSIDKQRLRFLAPGVTNVRRHGTVAGVNPPQR